MIMCWVTRFRHACAARGPSPSPGSKREPTSTPAPAPTVAVSPVATASGNSAAAPFGSPHRPPSAGSSGSLAPDLAFATDAELATDTPSSAPTTSPSPPPATAAHPRLLTPKQLLQQVCCLRAHGLTRTILLECRGSQTRLAVVSACPVASADPRFAKYAGNGRAGWHAGRPAQFAASIGGIPRQHEHCCSSALIQR